MLSLIGIDESRDWHSSTSPKVLNFRSPHSERPLDLWLTFDNAHASSKGIYWIGVSGVRVSHPSAPDAPLPPNVCATVQLTAIATRTGLVVSPWNCTLVLRTCVSKSYFARSSAAGSRWPAADRRLPQEAHRVRRRSRAGHRSHITYE